MKRYALDTRGRLIEHKAGALVYLSDVQMQAKSTPHITGEYVALDDVRKLLGQDGRELIEDGQRFRFLLAITIAADNGDAQAADLLAECMQVAEHMDRRQLCDTLRHQAAATGWS